MARTKEQKERASTISYRLRTAKGIYKDLPKALPLDKNLSRGEAKSKLGSGRVS